MTQDKPITVNAIYLHLSLEEINLVLEALGQMPFVRVHQLIGKVQQQATEQLEEMQSKTKNQNVQSGDS